MLNHKFARHIPAPSQVVRGLYRIYYSKPPTGAQEKSTDWLLYLSFNIRAQSGMLGFLFIGA